MIQSVLFNKDIWSLEDAQKWLESHFLTAGKLDQPAKYYRYRQSAPNKLFKYRTHSLGKSGIKLILGYPTGQVGDGLFSKVKDRIKLFMTGPKKTAMNSFTKVIESDDSVITDMWVNRTPVQSAVTKIMNWISQGKLEAKRKELGYDEIYHSFIVVKLANGKMFRIEKNEVAVARAAKDKDLDGAKKIPMGAKKINMKELIAQASSGANNKLFEYSAKDNNCQAFIKQIVNRNGLSETQEVQKVIEPQNAAALVGSLGALAPITDVATDLAARGRRLIEGDGVKQKNKNKKNYITI